MENNRRNFLRNVIMAAAVSLLPKILQPSIPEVVEDEEIVEINIVYKMYNQTGEQYIGYDVVETGKGSWKMMLKKSTAELLQNHLNQ